MIVKKSRTRTVEFTEVVKILCDICGSVITGTVNDHKLCNISYSDKSSWDDSLSFQVDYQLCHKCYIKNIASLFKDVKCQEEDREK